MAKKLKVVAAPPAPPQLKRIRPLTDHQHEAFKGFHQGHHLCLHGSAGTGKTLLALYLSLQEIAKEECVYRKVILIRSVVPSREIGYLPGNIKEKIEIYETPYRDMMHVLTGYSSDYDQYKGLGKLDFQTTSHLRGTTFDHAIVVVDEFQNCNYNECSTVLTRIGDSCRIIYSGDTRQSDLREYERHGAQDFLQILKAMPSFQTIEFDHEDIVRGPLVKEFLIEEKKYFAR